MKVITAITTILTFNIHSLIFHEYHLDLFNEEAIKTEQTAYKLLKNKPIQKNINYLVVPWSVLINKKELHKAPQIKLDGGFTICQHIDYEKIIPILKKIGINVLFTPHVTKKYEGITVLPFPHLAVNAPLPDEHKDIFYSFIGANTHWTRKEIFNLKHPLDCVVKERNEWHFYLRKKERLQQDIDAKEYKDVLARSTFSLCPRGTGASTLRFWESLKAGAIPVLISDNMQLPAYNWKECIIKISEKKVKDLNKILKKINKQTLQLMAQKCLEAYKNFSEENFVKCIREFYL